MIIPKISILTPSYNQAGFIESTIQSVLNQHYSNLEYIVIDGGSTDDTVNILKKYNDCITYWVSESDKGQSDAMNKGFKVASGDIIGWLNSDDTFQPGILDDVIKAFRHQDVDIVMSEYFGFMDKDGHIYGHKKNWYKNYKSLVRYWKTNGMTINQPCVFFRRKLIESLNPVMDTDLHYAMDYDLWLRIAKDHSIRVVPGHWANYRFHETNKSGKGFDKFFYEWNKVSRRYWGHRYSIDWWQNWGSYTLYKFLRALKNTVIPRK